jgi:hypothetical protein
MTPVKNSIGGRRFFMFAPGTPAGIGSFSSAVVCIAAFPANIPIAPLLLCEVTETILLCLQLYRQFLYFCRYKELQGADHGFFDKIKINSDTYAIYLKFCFTFAAENLNR